MLRYSLSSLEGSRQRITFKDFVLSPFTIGHTRRPMALIVSALLAILWMLPRKPALALSGLWSDCRKQRPRQPARVSSPLLHPDPDWDRRDELNPFTPTTTLLAGRMATDGLTEANALMKSLGVLVLLAVIQTQVVHAQTLLSHDEQNVANFAFATQLGSGVYSISGRTLRSTDCHSAIH